MARPSPKHESPDIIETARLVLRRPVLGDAEGLYAMLSDPQLFHYSPVPLAGSLMDVKHIIVDSPAFCPGAPMRSPIAGGGIDTRLSTATFPCHRVGFQLNETDEQLFLEL